MKKYLDIKGLNVLDEFNKLKGAIEDCLIDVENKKVSCFVCIYKHFMAQYYFLFLKDVKYLDGYLVSNEAEKVNRSVLNKNRDYLGQRFIHKEIINTHGKIIGNLSDFIFEEDTGTIKALICSKGFFDDIFEGKKIIIVDNETKIEKDRIIVPEGNIDMVNDIFFRKYIKGD
jgi:uncharacterized protein YrrD